MQIKNSGAWNAIYYDNGALWMNISVIYSSSIVQHNSNKNFYDLYF